MSGLDYNSRRSETIMSMSRELQREYLKRAKQVKLSNGHTLSNSVPTLQQQVIALKARIDQLEESREYRSTEELI